jgi:hypothetical protein
VTYAALIEEAEPDPPAAAVLAPGKLALADEDYYD